MLHFKTKRSFTVRAIGLLLMGSALFAPLAGCDLAKNQLKTDRSSDMETQDYRDALAQRLPEIKQDKRR